ncbi:MAG TPA: hypothetical protein VFK13_11270 [Gemmatimonadaceae bacterium]|nr:hypothetical protein [Gemmatimonadaceae bacterium]
MILANVRASLERDDAQLALRLIARGSAAELEAAEERLRDEGIDALLDDPRLLTALVGAPLGARSSLPLFCYVVVRHAMRQAGEDDRVLCDYVASLLLHFGMRDRAHQIAPHDDEQYATLAALLDDVDGPDARRTFLVRAHLGNYALWLSGLFPDHIEYRSWRRGGPDLGYYEDLGRRGYQLAAEHTLAREHGMASLFLAAAERFAALRIALNRVSDTLLFPHHHTPDRLMRQVRDVMRYRLPS